MPLREFLPSLRSVMMTLSWGEPKRQQTKGIMRFGI